MSWLSRRRFQSVRSIRREFRSRIDRFKRTSKGHVRATLLADPRVAACVAHAPCRVVGYAIDPRKPVAWEARGIAPSPDVTGFRLVRDVG